LQSSEQTRLEQRLAEVTSQLLRSVDAYEQGHTDEARRMALAIRILLHDTSRQTSLLTHLGLKQSITYYDTASEIDPRQHGSHLSLLTLLMPIVDGKPGPSRVEARLDNQPQSPKSEMQEFATWWTMPVIRDDRGETYSRQDIVLFLANQDGGAHVDLKVDPKYLRLARGEATEWRPVGPSAAEFVEGIELATARQVAHEVLVTLARHHPGCFPSRDLAGRYANEAIPYREEAAWLTDVRVYTQPGSLGRNDLCWCGSGRKLKQCHESLRAMKRHQEGKRQWGSA